MASTVTIGSADGGSFGPVPTTLAEAEGRIRDLEAALVTRHVIGVAQGMLMEREHLTVTAAFDVLRRVSQNTNVRLASVAVGLVETGVIADPAMSRRRTVDDGAEGRLRLVE